MEPTQSGVRRARASLATLTSATMRGKRRAESKRSLARPLLRSRPCRHTIDVISCDAPNLIEVGNYNYAICKILNFRDSRWLSTA